MTRADGTIASEDAPAAVDAAEERREEQRRDIRDRRAKVEALRAAGVDPFPRVFPDRTHVAEIVAAHDPAQLGPGPHAEHRYRVAGRLIARRGHGKTSFLDVRDRSGTLQVVAREDLTGEDEYRRILDLDIGDVVGAEGCVYVTQRGQLALSASECTLLSKALRKPPEKHRGIEDPETRYRHRELDLIANERSRTLFTQRAQILTGIRDWMNERGFIEVDTPILQSLSGGAAARPFVTHHNALDRELSMRISTELYLKRFIVGGLENVYDLGKCFRNEGISHKHNPEFLMLEWFQCYSDYRDVVTLIENVVSDVAQRVLGTMQIERDGHVIDLTPPWRRVSARDAIREATGLDIIESSHAELAAALGDSVEPDASWSQLVETLHSKIVEPGIVQPTFIMDFPAELFPLAKRCPDEPQLAEAFDAVIAGIEIASGSTDVNDPDEQRARFVEQRQRRRVDDDDEPHPHDEEFVQALEYGLLPLGGAGMGVDRVVMILTGATTMRDVVPFPVLRDRG